MAKKFVSRVLVMRNGAKQENMKSFVEGEVPYASQIDLMDETGTADIVNRYTFALNYVIPVSAAKMDWSDVRDETWVVQNRPDGSKRTYTGVDCLSRGEVTFDGQGESVMRLNFVATDMVEG